MCSLLVSAVCYWLLNVMLVVCVLVRGVHCVLCEGIQHRCANLRSTNGEARHGHNERAGNLEAQKNASSRLLTGCASARKGRCRKEIGEERDRESVCVCVRERERE